MEGCIKVVMCGDSQVGKTSLVKRFVKEDPLFSRSQRPTLGTEFFIRSLKGVKLQIWDTAGQERFRKEIPSYALNARILIFVFDVNVPASFGAIESTWKSLTKWKDGGDEVRAYLVGTQADKSVEGRVDRDEADAYARASAMGGYFECSAKTGDGVDALFEAIVSFIGPQHRGEEEEETRTEDFELDEYYVDSEGDNDGLNGRGPCSLLSLKCCK